MPKPVSRDSAADREVADLVFANGYTDATYDVAKRAANFSGSYTWNCRRNPADGEPPRRRVRAFLRHDQLGSLAARISTCSIFGATARSSSTFDMSAAAIGPLR